MSFWLLVFLLLCLLVCASAHRIGYSSDDSDYDSPINLRSKSLIWTKIWCLILVFIGTFLGGLLPYLLKWKEGLLAICTQFAGGVFLGMALMQFLSDSNEAFRDLSNKEYPFAFMLASAGYLLAMLADSVVSYINGKMDDGSAGDVEHRGGPDRGKAIQIASTSELQFQASDGAKRHIANPSLEVVTSLADSTLLISALCIRSVFEGIVIGITETKAEAWRVMWTVYLHKIFAAIAMGIALLRAIPDRPLFSCVVYAFALAISSPVGVAIGIVMEATTQGVVADWIYAISMGIACGVLIYVSINHLLSKGCTPVNTVSVDTQHYKFLAVLLGISVIAFAIVWD